MSKWTKEQLETAKYILKNGCNKVSCGECKMHT